MVNAASDHERKPAVAHPLGQQGEKWEDNCSRALAQGPWFLGDEATPNGGWGKGDLKFTPAGEKVQGSWGLCGCEATAAGESKETPGFRDMATRQFPRFEG